MENFARFAAQAGRIALEIRVIRAGRDAQCLLGGGNAHIGAVALACPGAAGGQDRILRLPGHREDEIALRMARTLAQALGCAICVSAGIHFDNITREEITVVENLADELTEKCLDFLARS
ncbi:MAG: hypothetical protein LBQ10_04275 [Desulfovibrio sp.]|nr:hypothetical protein [Desulfovibrio sp.]